MSKLIKKERWDGYTTPTIGQLTWGDPYFLELHTVLTGIVERLWVNLEDQEAKRGLRFFMGLQRAFAETKAKQFSDYILSQIG